MAFSDFRLNQGAELDFRIYIEYSKKVTCQQAIPEKLALRARASFCYFTQEERISRASVIVCASF
jgi:hypothetical protein